MGDPLMLFLPGVAIGVVLGAWAAVCLMRRFVDQLDLTRDPAVSFAEIHAALN